MPEFTLKQVSDALAEMHGQTPSKVHTRNREIVRAGLVGKKVKQGQTAKFDETETAALAILAYYAGVTRSPNELKRMVDSIIDPKPKGKKAGDIPVYSPNTIPLSEVVKGIGKGLAYELDLFVAHGTDKKTGEFKAYYTGGYRKAETESNFDSGLIEAKYGLDGARLIEQRILYVTPLIQKLFEMLAMDGSQK